VNHKTERIESKGRKIGLTVIVVIVMMTTVWLYTQASHFGSSVVPLSKSFSGENPLHPGFRSDAWFLPDDELLGFVDIPGGGFLMGADPTVDPWAFDNERWSPEQALGTVDVPNFFIGRYEVTVAQFRSFVKDTGFSVSRAALEGDLTHPVGNVSWPDAISYSRWLQTRLEEWSSTPNEIAQVLKDGWIVTLPTEAQWEKAARGTDGRIFPWGDSEAASLANFGSRQTSPVGSHPCPGCPFELFDMSGNVWELTRSPYQPYPYNLADDRNDLRTDALWVMRGGSYADPVRNVRTSVRGGADPGARRPFIGFRVVITRVDS